MKLKIGPHFVGDDETTCVITGAGANNRIFNMSKKLIGIAIYEKAMNNGYPIAEIVGKWDVMDAAQNTFISSTYRTERIGPMASIATINKMQENDVPSYICKIGDMTRIGWENLAQENDFKIHTEGISPLPTFNLVYDDSQALHTLFTQEMLGRGYLASKSVYVS